MFKLKHPNVKILGGLPAFVGQTGVIVDKEGKLYRVKFDSPVEVPDVGLVTDDLWEPKLLKVIRPPLNKPGRPVAVDAPADEAPVRVRNGYCFHATHWVRRVVSPR